LKLNNVLLYNDLIAMFVYNATDVQLMFHCGKKIFKLRDLISSLQMVLFIS